MRFRRLEPWEHGKTRRLYEAAFPEDSREFVDYYYTWKTRDNRIYAAEDPEGIHSMVQLNPFLVSVRGTVQPLHYIVAVATEKAYRRRGLMRRLMELAMREMEEAGEPFTFLMPASEAIYRPLGFETVSWQRRGILPARPGSVPGGFSCRAVRPEEYPALAGWVNKRLAAQADVFVFRDVPYYERLSCEQRSQGGEIMAILSGQEMIGTFCTSREETEPAGAEDGHPAVCSCALREVIVGEGRLREAELALQPFAGREGTCAVEGCPDGLALCREERVPLMMARRLACVPGGEFAASPPRFWIHEVV